jgi:Protein kinase G tetratricopeptide repeat
MRAGDPERLPEAADLYEQVAMTDPSWGQAVAGLADALNAQGRREDAARVLTAIPAGHPLRTEALTRACRAMEEGTWDPVVAAAAGEQVRAADDDTRGAADAELAAALYGAALAALARGEQVGEVAGQPGDSRVLAERAEEALLDLADATANPPRRHELLDAAARTRPWSVW